MDALDPSQTAARRPVRRRLIMVLAVVSLVVPAGVLAVVVLGGGSDGDRLLGEIATPVPAPATTGTGHDGAPVRFPTPGRPGLMTFLYTDCPDVCPLISEEVARALDQVGEAASGLDVVAISVDPRGDTPAAVAAFLETHRLTGRMRYMIGTEKELAPLWRAWQVAAQKDFADHSVHSARIVLVDANGQQVSRFSAGVPISIDDLASDIKALLA